MIVSTFFGDQGGGSPVLIQHFSWFLGNPQTWVAIGGWVLFLLGAAKLLRRFRKAGNTRALVLLALAVCGFVACYIWLFQANLMMFTTGEGDRGLFLALRVMSWTVLGLGICSAIWILRDLLGKRAK